MARTIRIHLDEHIPNAVAAGLRRLGVDVTTTHEAGLLGAGDPELLAFVNAEDRIHFTEDADFLVLASLGLNHPGIVYCKQNTRSIGETFQPSNSSGNYANRMRCEIALSSSDWLNRGSRRSGRSPDRGTNMDGFDVRV